MDTERNLLIAPFGLRKGIANPPNLTQRRALDWVDKIRKNESSFTGVPVLYLQGGVGSGKTRALLAPVLEMLCEIPDLRVLWARQDFADLRLSALETFFEVIPPELVVDKNVQEHRYRILQNNGATAQIFFRELKDLTGLGSQEFGVIVITEAHEISEQAFMTLKMRVRQANMPTMILMEGNPPNEGHWLERFTNPKSKDYDLDIEMWEVSTYENWENLPLSYRNSLERMPEAWKKKYLYGKFGFTPDGKPFYQGFMENLHNRKLQWFSDEPIYRSWDYGYHHPFCSFHQIDAKGRWLILKEILGTEITIEKFGNFVKIKSKEWFPNAQFVDYGDPAGNQKTDKSEKTSVEVLASLGIFVTSKRSEYRERKEIIERKLSTLIDGIPALVVDESCKIIIDGFLGGYHYPEQKQNQAFNPALFEVPFRDGYWEHALNSVEYAAVNLFTGAETIEDNSETSYRVVGPLKDIHFFEETSPIYRKYQQVTNPSVEDE